MIVTQTIQRHNWFMQSNQSNSWNSYAECRWYFTYTPTTGYIGNDSYTYKVCDPAGKCDTATVTIGVIPPQPQVCLLPQAYLQGALFGVLLPDVLMRDDLRTKGLIPTTSPYVAMGLLVLPMPILRRSQ